MNTCVFFVPKTKYYLRYGCLIIVFFFLLNAAGKQLRHVDNDGENWEGGTD